MHKIQVSQYENQLKQKTLHLQKLFKDKFHKTPDVFASPKKHYRMRAEFRVWHKESKLHYVMFEKGNGNQPIIITEFPQAHESIEKVMQPLLNAINQVPLLAARLFQIEYLCTQTHQVLVTLIYHKNLSDEWEAEARKIQDQFSIDIIGRARKQKRVLNNEYVTETLNINSKNYNYHQYENSFSQPNAKVCEQMVEWILSHAANSEGDLLELYCGNGNFTLPLATKFNKVLATEVSKTSIKAAKENALLNNIENIAFVRLSSHEIAQAFNGEREFRRLAEINLQNYTFNTVFVDPPRAGLDLETINLIKQFDRILYISCNPNTLKVNIDQLNEHKISAMALFDQFPYTEHIECGVVLEKI